MKKHKRTTKTERAVRRLIEESYIIWTRRDHRRAMAAAEG